MRCFQSNNIGILNLPVVETVESHAFASITDGDITLGSVGHPVKSIDKYAFRYSKVKLTIYTADGQPLSTHPYSAGSSEIIYKEA